MFLVEDTSIHIRWDNLSLPPSISAIFQGYKVFIRPEGSADVIVTTVNDLVNFVTIEGLEPLVTYNLTVAGYTQSGVGRESESLSVTTTLGRVISLGLRCARLSSAINQIILSQNLKSFVSLCRFPLTVYSLRVTDFKFFLSVSR